MSDPLLDALVYFGVPTELAGAFLALILVTTLVLIFRMVLGEMKGFGFIVPAFLGLAVSFAIGWLPVWVAIVFVLGLVAFIVLSMKGGSGE